MADPFNGFPREAFTFFRQLARNNNRDWFLAHRETYEVACREPMRQLIAALALDAQPGLLRSRFSIAVDFPPDPKRIANDAVAWRPVRRLQRHEHFAAVR
jgi:uncharacterized protein (DUF2461 family)